MQLVQALEEKWIAGAAVNVFDVEPPPNHSWLQAPRLYVTPHLGGTSREAILRIGQAGMENVLRMVRDEPLRDIVNGMKPDHSSSEKG